MVKSSVAKEFIPLKFLPPQQSFRLPTLYPRLIICGSINHPRLGDSGEGRPIYVCCPSGPNGGHSYSVPSPIAIAAESLKFKSSLSRPGNIRVFPTPNQIQRPRSCEAEPTPCLHDSSRSAADNCPRELLFRFILMMPSLFCPFSEFGVPPASPVVAGISPYSSSGGGIYLRPV